MPDLNLAANIATIISTIAAAAQFGISYRQAETKIDRKEIERQAKVLTSTYNDAELTALHERIQTCRDTFINEGSGKQRVRCMCSVLENAIVGNGGIPPLPEWEFLYLKLCT